MVPSKKPLIGRKGQPARAETPEKGTTRHAQDTSN